MRIRREGGGGEIKLARKTRGDGKKGTGLAAGQSGSHKKRGAFNQKLEEGEWLREREPAP